jgi:tRNA(Ile)-lysidine synthase
MTVIAFFHDEIAKYAKENNIEWKTAIRHDKYYTINSAWFSSFVKKNSIHSLSILFKKQSYLQESQAMVENASIMVYQQVAEGYLFWPESIACCKLQIYCTTTIRLHEFWFSAWDDITL